MREFRYINLDRIALGGEVFSYIFMKILESRPRSYDRLMEKTSRGRTREIKQTVATETPEGAKVLEIGCGTGELAAMLVEKNCVVDGFDASPQMIEAALETIETKGLSDKFSARQMGVDGMDQLSSQAYDAVISTLVFSELTDDERRYAFKHAARVLKPGGVMVVADEVTPRSAWRKLVYTIIRLPLLIATFLVSRAATRPITDLAGEIAAAGFKVEKEVRSHGDAFSIVVGKLSVDR